MLRALALVALLSMVVLALYLPSQYPAAVFFERVRAEHEVNQRFWGSHMAEAILERALELDEASVRVPEKVAPEILAERPVAPATAATARRLSEMKDRFFRTDYVQALRATRFLVEYRLVAALEWSFVAAVVGVLAILDGLVLRKVRAHEFGDHNPARFGVLAFLAMGLVWLVGVSFMWPGAVHPLFYGVAPVALALLLGGAVANLQHTALRSGLART